MEPLNHRPDPQRTTDAVGETNRMIVIRQAVQKLNESGISAKLFTATIPPQIEIHPRAGETPEMAKRAARAVLAANNWGFEIRVGSPFTMHSQKR